MIRILVISFFLEKIFGFQSIFTSINSIFSCSTGVKKVVKGVTHYILTDPAVHSVEESFGATDCGVAGMYKVIAGHRCNDICKQLGLDTSVGAM